jgi:hypothetical protein
MSLFFLKVVLGHIERGPNRTFRRLVPRVHIKPDDHVPCVLIDLLHVVDLLALLCCVLLIDADGVNP